MGGLPSFAPQELIDSAGVYVDPPQCLPTVVPHGRLSYGSRTCSYDFEFLIMVGHGLTAPSVLQKRTLINYLSSLSWHRCTASKSWLESQGHTRVSGHLRHTSRRHRPGHCLLSGRSPRPMSSRAAAKAEREATDEPPVAGLGFTSRFSGGNCTRGSRWLRLCFGFRGLAGMLMIHWPAAHLDSLDVRTGRWPRRK